MKKLSYNVRLNKSGQPRKGEIERVKANIKANFDKVKKEDLSAQPKAIISYYNQIESGKKRGELNKKRLRIDGKFLSKPAAKALTQRAEQFILDKKLTSKYESAKEFLAENPSLAKKLYNVAVKDIWTTQDRTDKVFDFIGRNSFEKINLIDQNGNRIDNITKHQAEFIIRESLRELFLIFKGDKFQSWNKYSITNAGREITINYFNMEGLEGESPETIQIMLSKEEKDQNTGAYGSPTAKGKAPKSKNKNYGTKKNKKPNRKKPNK
jgi:hypothetical protein